MLCLLGSLQAAERVKSFDEALEKAGADGIIAYCYGPDWNMRSTRMLRSFWNTPALEEAAGNAILVAVPFYQDPYTKGADKAPEIQGSMPPPRSGICPSVLMFDKNGRLYASLQGGDGLYQNKEQEVAEFIKSKKKKQEVVKPPTTEELEEGKLGMENIKKNLGYLRQQQDMLAKAETATLPNEKAKLITQAAELPIVKPEGYVNTLTLTVPMDEDGYVKRGEYSALAFMYEQLETSDGFLKDDFFEDAELIEKACKKIYEDEQYRPEDRQAALALMLGAKRRAGESGSKLKSSIKKMAKIDPNTNFGLLSIDMMDSWGKKARMTPEEKRALADKKKEQEKIKKANKTRDRRAGDRYTIE
ncbi:MAG: hypothetical protein R3Y56_03700 [Akkermansia sp.]